MFLFGTSCLDNTPDMPKELEKLPIKTVLIPAGTFTMGSPVTEKGREDDETQYNVTLTKFRMSKYEITNSQYAAFLNAKGIGSDGKYVNGSYPTKVLIYASNKYSSENFGLIYNVNKWEPVSGYENNPVRFVTWYGAKEFATYVGGTLPTEAQWEYACRAGTTTAFNTGDFLTNLQANYDWEYPYNGGTNTVTTSLGTTQAVGTYAPNGYGLYDMHGNVYEWCNDWYGEYSISPQTNPTGPLNGSSKGYEHVIRGGSIGEFASSCRSANRTVGYSDFNSLTGFRIVFDK